MYELCCVHHVSSNKGVVISKGQVVALLGLGSQQLSSMSSWEWHQSSVPQRLDRGFNNINDTFIYTVDPKA